MILRIANKAHIPPGWINSYSLFNWNVTIFNIKGKFCFYTKKNRAADTDLALTRNSPEDFPYMLETILNAPEVVITSEEDICIVIDDVLEDEINQSYFANT